jgi:hypothetical protein
MRDSLQGRNSETWLEAGNATLRTPFELTYLTSSIWVSRSLQGLVLIAQRCAAHLGRLGSSDFCHQNILLAVSSFSTAVGSAIDTNTPCILALGNFNACMLTSGGAEMTRVLKRRKLMGLKRQGCSKMAVDTTIVGGTPQVTRLDPRS